MADIVSLMRTLPDFNGSCGRDEAQILRAEEALGLHFAPDYRLYLREIGLACFDGRELTGLCDEERLDVVAVTLEERARTPEIGGGCYVIEQANIDGIVIWQNASGAVLQTMPGCPPAQRWASLEEYIRHD